MGGHFDLQSKTIKINELETELQDENIWNNIDHANKVNSELVNLKKTVSSFNNLSTKINDSISLLDILSSEDKNELKELEIELNNIKNEINDLEIETLLNGPYDNSSCYLEIHPGAGGTEACDWADMLLRMYIMFCDKDRKSVV